MNLSTSPLALAIASAVLTYVVTGVILFCVHLFVNNSGLFAEELEAARLEFGPDFRSPLMPVAVAVFVVVAAFVLAALHWAVLWPRLLLAAIDRGM